MNSTISIGAWKYGGAMSSGGLALGANAASRGAKITPSHLLSSWRMGAGGKSAWKSRRRKLGGAGIAHEQHVRRYNGAWQIGDISVKRNINRAVALSKKVDISTACVMAATGWKRKWRRWNGEYQWKRNIYQSMSMKKYQLKYAIIEIISM